MKRLNSNVYPEGLEEYRKNCDEEELYLLEILAPIDSSYTNDAVKAWKSLYNRWHKNPYNIKHHGAYGYRFWWITNELDRIRRARILPKYEQLTESEKVSIRQELAKSSAYITKQLKDFELDGSLLHLPSKLFGDWHIYEDVRDRDKPYVKEHGSKTIHLSQIIEFACERAINTLKEAEYHGKQGRNASAVAFLRRLLEEHSAENIAYGKPLYGISALFTNLLYDTNYDESSARKLFV